MSNTRYLRQRNTGRIFVYTELLAARNDMIEVDGVPPELLGESAAVPKQPAAPVETAQTGGEKTGEGDGAPAGDGEPGPLSIKIGDQMIPLEEATKEQIAEYAEKHFGKRPDGRKGRDAAAAFLAALIEEHGHPDLED